MEKGRKLMEFEGWKEVDGRQEGWKAGRLDGWTAGRTVGRTMDGRTDGRNVIWGR